MDLSWSSDGVILAASSFDGSVVLINFQDDFGEPMSKNELVRGPNSPHDSRSRRKLISIHLSLSLRKPL